MKKAHNHISYTIDINIETIPAKCLIERDRENKTTVKIVEKPHQLPV